MYIYYKFWYAQLWEVELIMHQIYRYYEFGYKLSNEL